MFRFLFLLALSAWASFAQAAGEPAETNANELLAQWTGPFGGVPAFDKMDVEAIKPALETAIERGLAEQEAIANQPSAPTFENTIAAMEQTGRDLDLFMPYWNVWSANVSSPEFRAVQKEMAPKLAEYYSLLRQNERLFARVKSVYEGEEFQGLEPAQQRLVWLIYDRFASNGVNLEGAAKERYAAINQRLAELQTGFANNLLADEEAYVTYLNESQLGGLPESFRRAAAESAAGHGRPGLWAVTNTRSSMDPFLTYADDRSLRETVWRNYYNRGNNHDENDNNAAIVEILQLRDERAALMGQQNFASWRLQNRMAKTPAAVMNLLLSVWRSAVVRVQEEVADMQAVADAEGAGVKIAPWDYRYYAEKVRKAKYELDSDQVKQYLQLDNVYQAMFMVARELFNLDFTPLPPGTVPVFHPDVRVWDVTNRQTGAHVGLWYSDPFARAGKRSGAWTLGFRNHETFNGLKTALLSNNTNFVAGAPGEPVLLSWDDAETAFHEFGHALHGLSSNVAYPTLNSGVRDFTEFQSQLLEHWLLSDRVIRQHLLHYKTGEPMPADLVEKIRRAKNFNQGFKTTEYLASALVDMEVHIADPPVSDPQAFESDTLAAWGMPPQLVMRHRSTQFAHIFSTEGYAAGYYSYLWADVLTSDAVEAFAEAPGGFYDQQLAKKLVDQLFSARNSVDPSEAYRAFRGRDAQIDALLRDRGFPVPAEMPVAN